MILDQTIDVSLYGMNIAHYESLGYKIPRKQVNGRKNRFVVPKGSVISVNINDLPEGSNELVRCKCDYCGKEFTRMYHLIVRSRKDGNDKDSCGDIDCARQRSQDTRLDKYGSISQVDICSINNSRLGRNLKYTIDDFIKMFEFKGLDLLINLILNIDNLTVSEPLPFICNHHKEMGIQYVSVDMLRQHKHCCKYGAIDAMTGENNWNWKGGIDGNDERHSYEYKKWRSFVYERDDFTCQCCGRKIDDIRLHAHHILNFSEYDDLKYNVDNGITLCEQCHSPNFIGSFHYIYGTKNNTREQLEEYINNKRNGIVAIQD